MSIVRYSIVRSTNENFSKTLKLRNSILILFSCSVTCFKDHKDTLCEELSKKKKESSPKYVEDKNPEKLMVYETIDTVPVERLEKLKESEELKDLLKNPHLRNYLQEINSAIKPWNAMKIAMQEPLFLEFADACLKVVQDERNVT